MPEIFCCGADCGCDSYKREGQVCFQYVCCDSGEILAERKDMPLWWIFVLKGEMDVSNQTDQEKVVVKAGEMMVLPSLDYRMQTLSKIEFIYLASERPTEYCVKKVSELEPVLPKESQHPVKVEISPLVNCFLELLEIYLKSGINCERLFEEKQEELFMLLWSTYSKTQLSNMFSSLVHHQNADLKNFIVVNCWRAKSVQELAQICGYSMSGFKRVFKEIFNEPVYRWMLQQKAERLRVKLAEEDVNLKEVSDDFGFSSTAHFTKFCKQWLGATPTKYMDEIRGRQNSLKLS